MTDEPYRWMEAIANRREYVEHQLERGSPLVTLSYADGILLFTLGRERQKLFEIYDRIGLGGIGHPGDLERMRMTAIELASTEGFARSSYDVSLRRLASYSLSPALKGAFEQIYGPPFIVRLLFAELGRAGAPDLFLRLDFDGSIQTNGGAFGRTLENFGVVAGTTGAMERMSTWLQTRVSPTASLAEAAHTALGAWAAGYLSLTDPDAHPSPEEIQRLAQAQLATAYIEAAVLEARSRTAATWRTLGDGEVRPLLEGR